MSHVFPANSSYGGAVWRLQEAAHLAPKDLWRRVIRAAVVGDLEVCPLQADLLDSRRELGHILLRQGRLPANKPPSDLIFFLTI